MKRNTEVIDARKQLVANGYNPVIVGCMSDKQANSTLKRLEKSSAKIVKVAIKKEDGRIKDTQQKLMKTDSVFSRTMSMVKKAWHDSVEEIEIETAINRQAYIENALNPEPKAF